ncbi:DUF1573 domain-containing protein [Carboxylicivirga caseinilyticus]|uniref:DUF1573 domain-containing protein n=1 Tax=Carboxylicivirga caseinilyticus TaxID=3417572 RepID=UPI003D3394E0|nr:DUF1573 domain-containing protein [Marinilabiliaceae bacterium A049]
MKRIFLILAVALAGVTSSMAQHAKANLSFSETIHDFGDIQESDGKVEYVFKFNNNGGQPMVLHNVKASCGCTTPEWTKTPIPPGGHGEVKAIFDPRNRPGNFNKTITVQSNAENGTVVLRITGNVIPREKTVEDIYPRNMDVIRLESSHLAFTKMTPDQKKTEQLKIISTSDQPLKISFANVPKHVTIKAVPEVLQPKQAGVITATYDAAAKSDWGFVTDNVFINFNDTKDYKNRLTLSASIEEDFDSWTPEKLAKAPIVNFEEKTWNFGDINQGDKVTHKFVVKNDGKSELIIRKVKASCGCTAIKPEKTVLAPGEETTIMAEFNSTGKSGRQNKSVTVVTNDPKTTTTLLRISGNVAIQ